MNPCIVYNYPALGGEHDDFALRFVLSYNAFPPGCEHDTVVISNGGEPTFTMRNTIEFIGNFKNVIWFTRQNTAKDIGGYQDVAKMACTDLMVFFGGSIFFWKKGWLKRVVESFNKHGSSIYGTMGNSGDKKHRVWPHIRTTGFWMSPKLLATYPMKVTCDSERYEFEHGRNCLTMWAVSKRLKPKVVTWESEYDMKSWVNVPNSFHRGDQSGLLFRDRLTEEPFYKS